MADRKSFIPTKLDSEFFKNAVRGENLLATIENMEKCKDIPGVIMLDQYGNEFSANPGDYFYHSKSYGPIETDGVPNILVAKRSFLINPLTYELFV